MGRPGTDLERDDQWPLLLDNAIRSFYGTPFEWGVHDCCISVCDVVYAMTETDLASEFRGYRGIKEAAEILKDNGGVEGIAETMAQMYNLPEITPAFAQRGDVVLLNLPPHGDTLGIVSPDGDIIASGEKGWQHVSIEFCKRAWSI